MRFGLIVALAAALGCTGSPSPSPMRTPAPARGPLVAAAERARVPGFAGATAWLNIDHAVTLNELAGHVVVVDFWTSCCINCLQTLPTLAAIEDKFASESVVVVGVHSPKFDAETERTRLSEAVRQYSIKHPVAVDGSMTIWNAWHVTSWPTIAVLDTKGRIAWIGSGEPDREALETIIGDALAEGRADGGLSATKLAGITSERDDTGPLAFPGKLTTLAGGGLAVSDTGHDRIVLVDASGNVSAIVGSGLAGNTDGDFAEASFRKPQGVTQLGQIIYVADTGNNELRAIDLDAKTVSTVAGTGELGRGTLQGMSPALTTALRSPWDVLAIGDRIYVALAGSHQIATFDPKPETIAIFAGDGNEARRDGNREHASFAQPSGLASDGKQLFVADSETSSIRAIDLATGAVRTIVGKDLFVFGDVDGAAPVVRLKHPLGVAFGAGALWVADTYNSKLKRIDPATGVTTTFAGGSDRVALFEPSAVVVRGNQLLVADTDHHRLVTFPLAGGAPAPIALAGLQPPTRGVAVAAATPRARASADQRLALGSVQAGPDGSVHIAWTLPAGTGINEAAPFRAHFLSRSAGALPADLHATGKDVKAGFAFALAPSPGPTQVTADIDVVVCDVVTHSVCVPVRREVSFDVRPDGAPSLQFPLPKAGTEESLSTGRAGRTQ